MITRHDFLVTAGATTATSSIASNVFAKEMDRPLGEQLYTVRSLMEKDVPGTLQAIRKIGYRNVETCGAEYKMSAKDLRTAILDAGLTVPSAHFGYNDFESRFEYAKELGATDIVCSMIPRTVAVDARWLNVPLTGASAGPPAKQFADHLHLTRTPEDSLSFHFERRVSSSLNYSPAPAA